jgi:DNA replication licensing factor MCM2|tara:strand:- start:1112 stop:1321 length:210 start_codon:yes stop_codon:yes gene_type:complete
MKRTRSKDYGSDSSDNGSGESLMENMEGDYAAIPELDDYDYNLLDSQNYETMEVAARRNAEVGHVGVKK